MTFRMQEASGETGSRPPTTQRTRDGGAGDQPRSDGATAHSVRDAVPGGMARRTGRRGDRFGYGTLPGIRYRGEESVVVTRRGGRRLLLLTDHRCLQLFPGRWDMPPVGHAGTPLLKARRKPAAARDNATDYLDGNARPEGTNEGWNTTWPGVWYVHLG